MPQTLDAPAEKRPSVCVESCLRCHWHRYGLAPEHPRECPNGCGNVYLGCTWVVRETPRYDHYLELGRRGHVYFEIVY